MEIAKQKFTSLPYPGTFHACVLTRAYVYAIFRTQEQICRPEMLLVLKFYCYCKCYLVYLFFAGWTSTLHIVSNTLLWKRKYKRSHRL